MVYSCLSKAVDSCEISQFFNIILGESKNMEDWCSTIHELNLISELFEKKYNVLLYYRNNTNRVVVLVSMGCGQANLTLKSFLEGSTLFRARSVRKWVRLIVR